MGQVSLQGSLLAGPAAVGSAGAFPGSSATFPLSLRVEPSSYTAATGVLQFSLDSALAFVQLGGIDTTIGPVKRGTLLVIRAPSQIRLRITTDNGANPDEVIELEHQGLFVKEWPDANAVLLVEAKGVSLVEYFASGPA